MSWPPLDTLKAFVTYGVAAFIIFAGMGAIYALKGDPQAGDTTTIFAGFIGAAITFLFNSEVQTRTARQAASATAEARNGHGAYGPPSPDHADPE